MVVRCLCGQIGREQSTGLRRRERAEDEVERAKASVHDDAGRSGACADDLVDGGVRSYLTTERDDAIRQSVDQTLIAAGGPPITSRPPRSRVVDMRRDRDQM